MAKYTFKQFQTEYPDDEACLRKLMEIRHGGTEIVCPSCGTETTFHLMTNRRAFACKDCGHHIYPCAGSIFHKSPTKLTIWFFSMYLMTSTRHGVAAKEVQRQTGVTYKTAWRICHELRKLMASADYRGPLSGHVEVDETLIGGKVTGHGSGRHRSRKSALFGMVERGGKLRAGPVPDESSYTLEPIILENVTWGSTISSDAWRGYGNLGRTYTHGVVEHKHKEYVRGIHHTNTIEGHWGHFKRAVLGTHVHISGKHLWKYAAEFNYRYNHRSSHDGMFKGLVSAFALPRLADD
ncbi:IS1595 family transposase [Taklimakanibacter deserti]|uniref:IS1595 family transposase n=1 Tax=Taklimakanibacter deserti TaxID=2267839 RepID=UPI0013C44E05